jgi:hypothetical protein
VAHINLTDLNNFMKNWQSGRIVDARTERVVLWGDLRNRIDREAFRGRKIEVLMQVTYPFSATGFAENQDLPAPQTIGHILEYISVKEMMATAGITRQALLRASGGAASWGRAVVDAIRNMRRDFSYLQEIVALGTGNGALARVSSIADNTPTNGYTTVTCDNTYEDFGVENVQLLRKDMWVDIAIQDTASYRQEGKQIYAKPTFGNRKNGVATTGSFVLAVNPGTPTASGILDNDVVFLQDSRDKLPTGLLGIVQDGVHFGSHSGRTTNLVSTFQEVVRSTQSSLQARIYQATDFGLDAESPVDGTPTLWDLSVISDAMSDCDTGDGGEMPDILYMHGDLARAIHRLTRNESPISVNVSSTRELQQTPVGDQYANVFMRPDGRIIPIKVSQNLPRNVIYGVHLEDLRYHPLAGAGEAEFDFLREYGDIWEPARGNTRATNFEAPFGGFAQFSAERCDNCIQIQDLTTAVA